jgi:pSer/pThr/pTyr-binding forkhead associated (FHA) protein/tetratricopeptide (TPR) repeat protein
MSAALRLEIYQNGEFLKEVPFENDELLIGRDSDCVIRLEDRAISRKHASLKATAQGVDFEKKSKFGNARVNGKDIEQATLKNGDRLEMGPYEIRVKQDAKPAVETARVTQTVAATPEVEIPTTAVEPSHVDFAHPEGVEAIHFGEEVAPVHTDPAFALETHPMTENTGNFDFAQVESDGHTRVFKPEQVEMKAVLRFGDGAANVTNYDITDSEVAIGRSQKCHVVLEDKRSSRKHSIIRREGKKYFVKDLGSANGTLVNGERVVDYELSSGDVLQIGDTQFTFQMLQADYDQKKDQFIQVVHEEAPVHALTAPVDAMPAHHPEEHFHQAGFEAAAQAAPAPDFVAPPPPKKSFIGNFLDRYRAMNTKQQMIYGAAILAAVYFLMFDDDGAQKKVRLNTGNVAASTKKVEKKPGVGPSFESLTPEQQRYVETEYQLSFDLYKSRDYDNSLLEVGKIFSLIQDYKNAREIEAFAREGKHKLEAQAEEKKKKEAERQAQIKLQNLLDQAGMLMDKKRFTEAETLFADIELLQPENAAVAAWRKELIQEKEKSDREAFEKKRIFDANQKAWNDFKKAKGLAEAKNYWDALDAYDELAARNTEDKKFLPEVKTETKRVEDLIAADRDPVFAQAKQLDNDGKYSEAYRLYQKVMQIDPTYKVASDAMAKISGLISGKAKAIYATGVFAESYSDWDTAEKRYREVLEVVPNDDPYYIKAQSRLKKITVMRIPAAETPQ